MYPIMISWSDICFVYHYRSIHVVMCNSSALDERVNTFNNQSHYKYIQQNLDIRD